jgi:nicotinate-nucleotide pyrophosphorylase (carboxylating)
MLASTDLHAIQQLSHSTCAVAVAASDGDTVQRGVEFGVVSGSARSILVAERICLNFMQRMSGIATATAAMVAAAAGHNAKCVGSRGFGKRIRLA